MDREALFDAAEEVLVPVDFQVGVQTALHQDTGAAEVKRLLDLVENNLLGEDIPLGVAHGPVERAKGAVLRAEIRVIDIAVNDVGDNALGMPVSAYGVGRHPDAD